MEDSGLNAAEFDSSLARLRQTNAGGRRESGARLLARASVCGGENSGKCVTGLEEPETEIYGAQGSGA